MDLNEYLLVNDIHLADRAPSSCTDSYLDDLFDLLTEIGKLARARRSRAVVFAGDVFHIKTPSRTSHRTVMRLIDELNRWPCPVFITPGNHDLLHDRLDSLDETQPLGVVFASGAAHPLDGWCDYAGGHPLYGVPWQQTWDDDTVTAVFDGWRRARPAGPVLAVAHAPLYPPGLELPYEFYPATAWAAAMGNHGTVHYGHVHEAHGIYTVDGVVFSNPGALSRGSLHEHNLTRQVALAAWNADTGTVQHLVLPHKPAEAVFRLVEADAAKTAALDLDRFLTAVGSHSLRITTTESIIEHLRGRDDITDDVRATAIELVEAVA